MIKIIVPCFDNFIKIWNFDSGELLKRIMIDSDNFDNLNCFCLLDEDYIVCGFDNCIINTISLKNGKIIQKFVGHKNDISNLQAVDLPNYGKCLISQGFKDDQIKLWKLDI